MKYYVGLTDEPAKFGRFSYREKFDYWAVGWGMVIMIGGGFVLMYPVAAAQILPGWAIPFALVAHSDEAVLAVGWILVVHMYFAHLHPLVFPMNKAIFTGKVPMHQYREEHGSGIRADHGRGQSPLDPRTSRRRRPVPAGAPAAQEPGVAEPA